MKKKTVGQASGASPGRKRKDYVPKQTKNLRGQAAAAAAVAAAAAAAVVTEQQQPSLVLLLVLLLLRGSGVR